MSKLAELRLWKHKSQSTYAQLHALKMLILDVNF